VFCRLDVHAVLPLVMLGLENIIAGANLGKSTPLGRRADRLGRSQRRLSRLCSFASA